MHIPSKAVSHHPPPPSPMCVLLAGNPQHRRRFLRTDENGCVRESNELRVAAVAPSSSSRVVAPGRPVAVRSEDPVCCACVRLSMCVCVCVGVCVLFVCVCALTHTRLLKLPYNFWCTSNVRPLTVTLLLLRDFSAGTTCNYSCALMYTPNTTSAEASCRCSEGKGEWALPPGTGCAPAWCVRRFASAASVGGRRATAPLCAAAVGGRLTAACSCSAADRQTDASRHSPCPHPCTRHRCLGGAWCEFDTHTP